MTLDPWLDWWSGWWRRDVGVPAYPLSLRPDEEQQRPERVALVPWEVCLGNLHAGLAPFTRSVVPLELVRPGDRQVVAQGRVGVGERPEPVDLGVLAEVPSVRSLIVDRPVTLSRPLPQVEELIALRDALDAATLANLPGLRRLCLGRNEEKLGWEPLLKLPLEALRVDAYRMGTIAPIAKLQALEVLRIDELSFESIAPVASCTRLRKLVVGWFKGMHTLGALERLEHLELNEGTVSSLKAFRRCRELRSLVVFGRKLKSLAGIEGMSALENLYLYNVGVSDLEPLTALPRLRRVRIEMPLKVVDFAPLGRIETLESLILHPKASRLAAEIRLGDLGSLRSLRELAVLGIDDGSGWEFVLDLPNLERVQLWGVLDPDAGDRLRERFPNAHVDVRSVEAASRPEGVEVRRLEDGVWSIFENVSDLLDVEDNFVAERRLRRHLRSVDPELLARLDFDSDADHLGVTADSEADVRRVAEEVRALAVTRS